MKIRNSFIANSSSSSFLVVFADEKTMLETRKKFLEVIAIQDLSSILNTKVCYEECLRHLCYCINSRAESEKTNTIAKLFINFCKEDIVRLYKIKKLIKENRSFYLNFLDYDDFESSKLITNLTKEDIIKEMIYI